MHVYIYNYIMKICVPMNVSQFVLLKSPFLLLKSHIIPIRAEPIHSLPLPTHIKNKSHLWGFPTKKGYPYIIHFPRILHYKPSSYWGTPIDGNLHIYCFDLPGSRLKGPWHQRHTFGT